MAHLEVNLHHKQITIRSQVFCGTFQDVGNNRKAVFVFLRALRSPETGNPLFTYETIARAFGYADRRNIQNYVGEFVRCGEDFQAFLSRTNLKRERLFPLIAEQVLHCPLLSPHEQYRAFCEAHLDERVSEDTFRTYVRDIDGLSLLKRVQQLVGSDEAHLDPTRYLQEILEADGLRNAKKKEIVELFPAAQASSSPARSLRGEGCAPSAVPKKLLVVVLYACAVSQDVLALLFGVGKTSIHNWIYEVCSEGFDWQMLREIVCWSGRISVDEKWVKIKGGWYFVLCAVDAESGFPLLLDLYPTLDTVSWVVFLTRVKAIYGLPTLIQCDGSQALAAARIAVFPGVRYQLWKFHKLKNLVKRLRQHLAEPAVFTRGVRLARHMFSNVAVSSRKAAAKRLQKLAGPDMASYIETHILMPWRQLTLSLTTNASERFNRKLEKCFSGRYGIPSEESANVLLRSLWLKELLLNGQHHLETTSQLKSLDVSRMCQEHLDPGNILHFFHEGDLAQTEKVA
jgi:transposase-like protein